MTKEELEERINFAVAVGDTKKANEYIEVLNLLEENEQLKQEKENLIKYLEEKVQRKNDYLDMYKALYKEPEIKYVMGKRDVYQEILDRIAGESDV